LVCRSSFGPDDVEVVDDARDFYGIGYWTHHQAQACGFPMLEERSRLDLPQRCVYWLRSVLRFARPAGRLFEVGASHGGFLHLARLAGFEIDGVEMSPAVVEYAQSTFGVTLRSGTVERVELPRHSQDVIVAFDVLEHLVDPCAALARLRVALKPGGLLVLQTPDFPVESYETLAGRGDRFIEQLRAPEHQYLFSRRSIERILAEMGFGGVVYEPPLFDYDMFVIAGGTGTKRSDDAIAEDLMTRPSGRTTLALLELHAERDGLRDVASHRQAVIDDLKQACDERLALIEKLDGVLRRMSP
jgi:2-polyprenyl-3-methyl-5-hydroxy-6-metoxy-1,4-benzoquinol methylase